MKRIFVLLIFAVVLSLGCGRNTTQTPTLGLPKTPAAAPAEKPPTTTPAEKPAAAEQKPYDASHDRIWTSMVHGQVYVRDSPTKKYELEFLQRRDDARITVPAPVSGTVFSVTDEKNYTALALMDENGKPYFFRLSEIAVKKDQKVAKGDTLGIRPGVARLTFRTEGPDGKPKNARQIIRPGVRELPPDANKF